MRTLSRAEAAWLRFALCLLLSMAFVRPALADIASADRALQQGRAAEAVTLLQPLIAAQPSDAAAHQLRTHVCIRA